jgi:asparagine synthase (glutamine-hydrolysing)
MCGIVGIVHRDRDRPVAPACIGRMCAAIRHRGPDDEGAYVDGAVGLGMRRLSIIDLARGRQPIFTEDRTKVIVFNGEIYNYRELRRDLLARGHQLATDGDTETIVHLYEELGERCVERLRGMFAFAIWDATTETLFLARDRFGIKPLYLVTAPWGVAFASELKALTAVGLTDRTLDWEALDTYFQLGYIPAPATPFTDIRKLEPGHTLRWRRPGSATVRRYWDLPTDATPAPARLEERVLEWLDESVAAHLVSDVPVAAFLSGGLDSSAVVASMAVVNSRPHAFTARYLGSGAAAADETALARRLAARYGAELTVIDIRPAVRDQFERIAWALDEPHADDAAIPTWELSRQVGAGYKVALTGIGGDELFAGYRRHLALAAGAYYARLPPVVRRAASAVANGLREPASGALAVNRFKRFLRSTAGAVPERWLGYLSRLDAARRLALYSEALRGALAGDAAGRHFAAVYRAGGSPNGVRAALYFDYKTYLPDDILALSDRLAMAHSLEIRVPLTDHVLVERIFPLPDRVKVGLWRPKDLLKRALRARLPAAHFRAPKRGFVGPTAAWLRHELGEMLGDELAPARLRALGYFTPTVVAELLAEHAARRHNHEGVLWALLCFSAWHRLHVEVPAPPAYASRGV